MLAWFGPEDGSFIVEDRQGGAYFDVQIQPTDQAIVAAGFAGMLPNGTISRFGVERYDSAGNVDTSYGTAGLASPTLGPGQGAFSLVLQADGKAVVAGDVGPRSIGMARLNVDGSPDLSFGTGGWTALDVQPGTDAATAVGLQASGKVVVAGYSNSSTTTSSGTQSALVARFKANGTVDSGTGGFGQLVAKKPAGYTLTSFGAKSHSYNAVAVQADDKLVAVGYSNYDDGSSRLVVARYTATGALDRTFNKNGYNVYAPTGISNVAARDVALQADGKIVVVGTSTGVDGAWDMFIARFEADGRVDATFGGGNGYVRLDLDGTGSMTTENANGVAIQPDGKIVVAGSEWASPAPGNVMVARLNANGTLDSTFGAGGIKLGSPPSSLEYHDFRGNAVALQSDGSIIVAGLDYWGTTGDTQHPLLMRFSGSTPSPLHAAEAPAATAPSHTKPLTLAQVQPMLTEAIACWQAAGVDVSGLGSLDVRISDLPDATLGLASGNTITLDNNAAGWGWFVDSTPGNSSEFLRFGNQGEQHRMDLLTVVMHELGHLLGHDHDEAGVMVETLAAGVRRTDAEHDHSALVDQIFGQPVDQHAATLFGDLLDEQLDSRRLWFKRRR